MPPPSAARPSAFERHARLTLAVVVMVATGALDLGFTRVYAIVRPEFYRDHSAFRVRSGIYHHGFKPNTSVDREYWGPLRSSYRIDSLGLRDAQVREVPLASAKPRVLLIGDSFTEGIGVPYEQTFAGRVAAALAPRGVEVLNAGVASYCPIIDYRRVKNLVEEVGLEVGEVVVFIDVGDIQDEVTYKFDEEGNVAFRQQRWNQENEANWYFGKPRALASLPLHNWLRKNTLAASTVYEALLGALTRGPQRAAAWTLDPAVFEAYGREGLARAQEHMAQLAELLSRHRIRLTVAVYPWKEQIRAHDAESLQRTSWREWSQAHGAAFIDCFPTFMQDAPEAIIKREFIPGDIHWNAAGHARVARVVLDYFEATGRRRGAGLTPAERRDGGS